MNIKRHEQGAGVGGILDLILERRGYTPGSGGGRESRWRPGVLAGASPLSGRDADALLAQLVWLRFFWSAGLFFFRFPWLGATRVAPSPDPDLRVGAEALARSLVESRPGGEMPSGVAVAASDWKSERLAVGASEAQHL